MGERLTMSKKELIRKSIFDLVRSDQITQSDASKRLNLSYRQTRRSYSRYLNCGDSGLVHKSRGRPSRGALSQELKASVLALYGEKYWDFGPTLAAEKLLEEDHYQVHAETLRLWLKEAGLWHPRRRRRAYRSRRARRSRFGDLLQLDGSIHCWFDGLPAKQCLMNLVDDATGKTLSLLASGETTEAAFELLKWWIKLHGIPLGIYVDLKSLYVSPKSLRHEEDGAEAVEPDWLTHFSRACKVLGIEIVKAYSPQAKGRVERSHGVYQDRLVKELRLKNIQTIDGANRLLQEGFIDHLNAKFMKAPASEEDAHISLSEDQNLDDIFCWDYSRVVQQDWSLRFENQIFQIQKSNITQVRPKQKITIKKQLNGTITLWAKGEKLPYQVVETPVAQEKKEKKIVSSQRRSQIARQNKNKSPWSQYNPGWLKQTKLNPQALF